MLESWLGGKVNANCSTGAPSSVTVKSAGVRPVTGSFARCHSNIGVDRRGDRLRSDPEANLGLAGQSNCDTAEQERGRDANSVSSE